MLIINHKGELFSLSYDETNRLVALSSPSASSSYSYDVNGFLSSITHRNTSDTILSFFNYQRDPNGNRTSMQTRFGEYQYAYDQEDQLVWSQNPEASGETFDYDNLGNRLNDELGSYSYDNKSQRLTEDYKNLYFYDDNGNLTSIQEKGMTGRFRNLIYSSENQLTGIEDYENNILTKQVSYKYDALGRRVAKEITDLQNSLNSYQRKYVYDGNEMLAEYDENNDILQVFTHSSLRTDDVLSTDVRSTKIATPGSYFYLKDALGSIVDITNSSGNLIQHYSYSSFGKLLKITDSVGTDITTTPLINQPFTFTNREYDSESKMMYYRARYYMPEIGRFISEDSHAGTKKMPSTVVNKYIYTVNNPQNYTDPSGRFIFTTLAIAGSYALSSYSFGVAATVILSAATTTAIGAGIAEIATVSSGGNLGDLYSSDKFREGLAVSFVANLAAFGALRYLGYVGKVANTGAFTVEASNYVQAAKVGAIYGAVSGGIQTSYYRARGDISDDEAFSLFLSSTAAGAITFGAAKAFYPKASILVGTGASASESAVYIYLPDGGGQD